MGRISSEIGHLTGVTLEVIQLEASDGDAVLGVEPIRSADGAEGISLVLFPGIPSVLGDLWLLGCAVLGFAVFLRFLGDAELAGTRR